jgi:hypothetical protein
LKTYIPSGNPGLRATGETKKIPYQLSSPCFNGSLLGLPFQEIHGTRKDALQLAVGLGLEVHFVAAASGTDVMIYKRLSSKKFGEKMPLLTQNRIVKLGLRKTPTSAFLEQTIQMLKSDCHDMLCYYF